MWDSIPFLRFCAELEKQILSQLLILAMGKQKNNLPWDNKGKNTGKKWILRHLEDVGDDVPLALLQEPILVKGWIHLEDLRQHLGHFRLGEQSPWKNSSVGWCHSHQHQETGTHLWLQSRGRKSHPGNNSSPKVKAGIYPAQGPSSHPSPG